jgi:hypothetical protein
MTRRDGLRALLAFAVCGRIFGHARTVLVVARISPRNSYLCSLRGGVALSCRRIPVIDPDIFSDVEFAESVRDAVNRDMPLFLAHRGGVSRIA